jgi:uncharacterized coiled-coil protein SlyX
LQEKEMLSEQVSVKIDEITELRTKVTEQTSKLSSQKEKIEALIRDLQIKSD